MDLVAEEKMKKEQIHDLGEILMGKLPARCNDEEITIYYQNGYYDQAHLIKEFKNFGVLSPNKYLKEIIKQ
jgi:AraC-like DNA-binding protein